MNALQQLRARMTPGTRVQVVSNTYRPALNGSIRIIDKVQRTSYRFKTVDGGDQTYWGEMPTRTRDVTWTSADEVTFPHPQREGYTITLAFPPVTTTAPSE
jgi:hypothetical protein